MSVVLAPPVNYEVSVFKDALAQSTPKINNGTTEDRVYAHIGLVTLHMFTSSPPSLLGRHDMAHELFSDTVLRPDGTIMCMHPETECTFFFRNPNDLAGNQNALHWKKEYPIPSMTHSIPTCTCPRQLRQFWHTEYQDNIVHLVESLFGELTVFGSIDAGDVANFWYDDSITIDMKEDVWKRVDNWERMLRTLATVKAAVRMGNVPKDLIVLATAYLQDGTVMWKFDDLRKEGDPVVQDAQPATAGDSTVEKPEAKTTSSEDSYGSDRDKEKDNEEDA
ncbi:hypothetical protein SCUP234_05619 [Seiridium cupressi]